MTLKCHYIQDTLSVRLDILTSIYLVSYIIGKHYYTRDTSSQKKSLLALFDSRNIGALAAMLPVIRFGYLNLI